MKSLLSLLAMLFAFNFAYAQNIYYDGETFNYNSNTVHHYGLGWYWDADASAYGPMAYLSSYGGIKFFTAGSVKGIIDVNGNMGIGTISPRDKLDLSTQRGINIVVGDRPAFGSLLGSAGTVIGQNIKADNTINDQMSFINTTVDGASAIKMQFNEGISFHTNGTGGTAGGAFSSERMRINPDGNVAIGTTDPHGYKFAVNGNAIATSMTVKLYTDWPDYVLKSTYQLPKLSEVKSFIDKNQHLSDMPSEAEVKKYGVNLGEMVKLQTKKIEELTLYLIEKDKEVKGQQEEINKLKQVQITKQTQQTQIDQLKQQLETLSKEIHKNQ